MLLFAKVKTRYVTSLVSLLVKTGTYYVTIKYLI
jgi:hypothetical protein